MNTLAEAHARLAAAVASDALDAPDSEGASRRVGDVLRILFGQGPAVLVDLLGTDHHSTSLSGQIAHFLRETVYLDEAQPIGAPPADDLLATAAHGTLNARNGATDALEQLESALAASKSLNDPVAAAYSHWYIAEHRASLGQADAARQAVDHALSQATRLPELALLATYTNAVLLLRQGLSDAALDLLDAQSDPVPGTVIAAGLLQVGQMNAAEVAGFPVRAAESAQRGMERFEEGGHGRLAALCRTELARMWVDLGRAEAAIALLRAAPIPPGTRLKVYSDLVLGHALLALGRPRQAHPILQRVRTQLPNGDHKLYAMRDELTAASWMGAADADLRASVATATEADADRESGPLVALRVSRRRYLGDGESPALLLARSRAHRDPGLVCAAAELVATEAMQQGRPDDALRAIEEARSWLSDASLPPLVHRLDRLQATWSTRYAQVDPAQLDRLVSQAQRFGDDHALAQALLLRSEATASSDDALRANGITEVRRLVDLRSRSAAVAACLSNTDPPAAHDDEQAVLVAASSLGDWREGLEDLERALQALPASNRRHIEALIAPSLTRVGLTRLREGPAPGLVLSTSALEVYRQGKSVVAFGKSKLQFQLLMAIVQTPDADRQTLFEAVWDQTYRPPSSDNTLHVHLSRLRARLAKSGMTLEAIGTGGYRLVPDVAVYRADDGS